MDFILNTSNLGSEPEEEEEGLGVRQDAAEELILELVLEGGLGKLGQIETSWKELFSIATIILQLVYHFNFSRCRQIKIQTVHLFFE